MNNKNNSVCAVIVTYNPELQTFFNLVENISKQVEKIIIVDNCSVESTVIWLKDKIEGSFGNLFCKYNEKNMGLAYAQNQGINVAIDEGFEFVILFDQDSTPSHNMVTNLKNAYVILNNKVSVAAVGPRFIDSRTKAAFPFIKYGFIRNKNISNDININNYEVDLLISSGCLIPTKVIENIGKMKEDLFIDCIDTEWCLRAQSKGYKLFGINNALMEHSIGNNIFTIWLGRKRNILIHSPLRKYYMTRNRILLIKEDYVPWSWKASNSVRVIWFL
jgi:rhamnosyltransferase